MDTASRALRAALRPSLLFFSSTVLVVGMANSAQARFFYVINGYDTTYVQGRTSEEFDLNMDVPEELTIVNTDANTGNQAVAGHVFDITC